MKKKNYKYKSSIQTDFIYWLVQQKKDDNLKKYRRGTAIAYAERLSRFCNKFFPAKKEEPLFQKEKSLLQFVDNIGTSMMCCCLCTSLKEPNEMLKTEEMRVLANAFFCYRVSKDQRTAHHQMFKDDLFEKMAIYLCRKKSGNEYQKVIELFYDFLKDTKFDGYSTLYEEIEERLEELRNDDSVFWKYGYIEATKRTPAMIIARAGQVGIPVSALTKIFKCDYRTIKKMLKENKISSCHHRKESVNIADLNAYFLTKHTGLYQKNKNGVIFTSKQEDFMEASYKALLSCTKKLQKINPTLSDVKEQKRKEEILKYINELLSDYQNKRLHRISCWSTCEEISKLTGKTNRTIQRAARAKKIPTTRYFKKKIGYFNEKIEL